MDSGDLQGQRSIHVRFLLVSDDPAGLLKFRSVVLSRVSPRGNVQKVQVSAGKQQDLLVSRFGYLFSFAPLSEEVNPRLDLNLQQNSGHMINQIISRIDT